MAKLLSGTRIYGSATVDTTLSLGTSAIFSGSTSGTTTLIASATAGTTTLTLPAATDTLVGRATTETLLNKTLSSPAITGSLTVSGSTGSNGYILTSTGSGVQWQAPTANTLDGLTDVQISSPAAQQVLKFNGSQWINADNDAAVASAVFATNAESDLGLVTDLIIGITEDLGVVNEVAAFIYNMGQLRVDGIVSLENLDQSVRADYTAYAIIFGF